MKITHIHIERFRGFQNEDFEVGSLLTAIAGQNGTQKSTLLGIITQTFTLKTEDSMRVEKPLCGGSYISAFKDKFKRLHDKYPRQYKGGILAIDEMDATMYPASQVELLKVLRKYASKLNL